MLRLRYLFLILFAFAYVHISGQVSDDFSDGDFTNNPSWAGDTANWEVVTSRLHLNSSAAGTSYLSTACTGVNNTTWEFQLELTANPSSANFVEVFLVSDLSDLSGAVNGYFVRLGGTSDEISLYKSTGGSNSEIIDGANSVIVGTNPVMKVRVTRDGLGNWNLERDTTAAFSGYVSEGSTNDVTFTTSAFAGVLTTYTSTRVAWCYFDSVNVTVTIVPDTTPPTVLSVTAINNTQLEVQFDEFVDISTGTTTGNFMRNGSQPADLALISASDSALVTLTYNSGFVNCVQETLDIRNVNDRSSNTMADTLVSYMYCVTAAAGYKSVIINEILADPTPSDTNCVGTLGASDEFIELYNRGTQTVDLQNWTINDGGSPIVISTSPYPFFPGDYVILTNDSVFLQFGQPVLFMSLPSLTNGGEAIGLRDNNGNPIDTVTYDNDSYFPGTAGGDGHSLELIDPSDTCSVSGNWTASVDTCQITPGTQNSVHNPGASAASPYIISVTSTGNNTIQVCFSESPDSIQAANPSFYNINQSVGSPSSASPIGPSYTCVDLIFPSTIPRGVELWLTADGVGDCMGNADSSGIGFLLNSPALPREVIFNEIMFDPEAGVTSMPNAEYVELYNRSAKTFDMNGWFFSDQGSPKMLTSTHILAPGDYVLLIHIEDTSAFTGLPYIPLITYPSLNNTGDKLGLRDFNGNLIDSVEFDLSTYQNTDRDDGGWSIELIDPEDTCKTFGNWIVHQDSLLGGTPATQNSVYALGDTENPVLQSFTIIAPDSILVCFNETMNATMLGDPGNFNINNGIGNPISVIVTQPGLNCAILVLSTPINVGTIYTIDFLNQEDCNGNPLIISTETFVQGGNAVPGQVVINEIMADPDETLPNATIPNEKYIELYNKGPNVVELAGWTINDKPSTSTGATLDSYNLWPDAYVILCAYGDTAEFSPFGPTLGVGSFPEPNITSDSLELRDAGNVLMDRVYYTNDWYGDPEFDWDGYSLERINPCASCMNIEQWHGSGHADGGTPGQQNTVWDTTFYESVVPTITGVELLNNMAIRLNFDEFMNVADLGDTVHYMMDNGLGRPVMVIQLTIVPTSVDLILSQSLDSNTVYCMDITGLRDCQGNPLPDTTVCFGIPDVILPGDIVINEILFNGPTGTGDYVELYNVSNKILDLGTLYISEFDEENQEIENEDQISTSQLLFLPGTYICLMDEDIVQDISEHYQTIAPDRLFGMKGFPTYGSNDGECIIYTDTATFIDRFKYLDDWHFSNLDDEKGVSLERHDFFRATQDEDNWHSAASTVNYGTPGYINSQVLVPDGTQEVWLEPTTFSPDQDGLDDVMSINYDFKTSGWNARVTVFDNKGRIVRYVRQNTLLGTERGTFTWDGTSEIGNKVGIGVYVILFEATNPNTGDKKNFKLGCVVAARL